MQKYQWSIHKEAILDRIKENGLRTIAIAGPTCSGKTTLANWLSKQIEAPIITMDDFYRDIDDQLLPLVDGVPNFDLPNAYKIAELDNTIQTLLAGRDTSLPSYDISTNTRLIGQTRPINANCSNYILEGLYAFLIDVRSCKVFVTASREARSKRRLARDIPALSPFGISAASIGRHFDRIEQISSAYFTSQESQADLIIDTTN